MAGTPGACPTAENIGWGTKRAATPAQMVAAWLQSPPHREVIFATEFHEAGVGATAAVPSLLAQGEPGATYALELGSPLTPLNESAARTAPGPAPLPRRPPRRGRPRLRCRARASPSGRG